MPESMSKYKIEQLPEVLVQVPIYAVSGRLKVGLSVRVTWLA